MKHAMTPEKLRVHEADDDEEQHLKGEFYDTEGRISTNVGMQSLEDHNREIQRTIEAFRSASHTLSVRSLGSEGNSKSQVPNLQSVFDSLQITSQEGKVS
ncbi:hypothetical protein NGA_0635800 [Nannochloropsis gaditana CCMP526]|uniref:uncharacterized protein n=1 Tax=Nannochloropsis gaditana (strain CCMP526) TaxID=1093141 RepID=UPI00029F5E9E|nr:hypothetical protein NGA_0635800 [Nannochloropsis gaditana CCMP526]EKU20628.1 hypothetical protein NGA_0635800 [Nannochloropsis gaditana CCMP526]|eukprot:XP_005855736.1 hypothetical protein NGA_0635800 [Nannochloropsis gaditana CCMP526]